MEQRHDDERCPRRPEISHTRRQYSGLTQEYYGESRNKLGGGGRAGSEHNDSNIIAHWNIRSGSHVRCWTFLVPFAFAPYKHRRNSRYS